MSPLACVRHGTAAACLISLLSLPVGAVTIDWVTVGNPGNANESGTGFGAVAEVYSIMTYEWTNAQYVEFLNAVDPQGTNPNGIYNALMASDPRAGITNSGTSDGSRYATRTNMGNKPVNYVDWWDVARVANWLQAGATTYGTSVSGSTAINSGAYTLAGAISGVAPAKNSGAQYWVPSKNEWYKAAYYSPLLNSGAGGYYTYATQSNSAPTPVTATTVGTGTSGGVSPVTTGNVANYNNDAHWGSPVVQNGNVTTVGSNGGSSYYGTFDQSGNVLEWNGQTSSSTSGLMGGSFKGVAADIDFTYNNSSYPTSGFQDGIGFRLVAVPEPASLGLVAFGAVAGAALATLRRHAARC